MRTTAETSTPRALRFTSRRLVSTIAPCIDRHHLGRKWPFGTQKPNEDSISAAAKRMVLPPIAAWTKPHTPSDYEIYPLIVWLPLARGVKRLMVRQTLKQSEVPCFAKFDLWNQVAQIAVTCVKVKQSQVCFFASLERNNQCMKLSSTNTAPLDTHRLQHNVLCVSLQLISLGILP